MFWWTSIAMASPVLDTEIVRSGRAGQRVSSTPADVVLLYGSEQRADQGPCGCDGRERGALGRLHHYADQVRKEDPNVLLVNAGNWLDDPIHGDGALRSDARVRNEAMMDAMEAGGWSFLNATYRDLPHARDGSTLPTAAGSANARRPGLPTYTLFPAGDVQVAITGVTKVAKPWMLPEDTELLEPVEALKRVLPEMRRGADVVVVTAYGLERSQIRAVAALDIDVLIEADSLDVRLDPVVVDDTVWVRTTVGAPWVGELRLRRSEQGWSVLDRRIDLDTDIRWPKRWRRRYQLSLLAARRAQAERGR